MTARRPDRIFIRDLALRCIVGVYPEERRAKQDIVINVTLEADFRRASASDDLTAAVDYKGIKQRIVALAEESRFRLIETLAEAVAAVCLEHPGVKCVTVAIDKPGALRFARSVAVEITRRRLRRR